MTTQRSGLGRRAARAATAAVVVAGGAVLIAGPVDAALPVPTITGVFVAGSTTNKVVTGGSTVLITGTGFSGMVGSAADPACSVTAVLASRCSQVRFNGLSADTNATGYTLATRYVVISDTQIYATVPTIAALAPTVGAPAAGTGTIRVSVVNTSPVGTSSLASSLSVTTATELFYRHRLTASLQTPTVTANPIGGATLAVDVTNVATLTSGTLASEKITAYFISVVAASPWVPATSVTFNDGDTVNVVIPPGAPADDFVGVMLVHDGVSGTADDNSLKYPALVSKVETCGSFTLPVVTVFPTCTGPANTAATPFYAKVSGKGLLGGTNISFDGTDGDTTETCSIVSNTVAYCRVVVNTVPSATVVAVKFTPADLDGAGPATTPVLAAIGSGANFGFYA